ncbi:MULTISPECIES: TPM domain-containing protein [Enterobacteriaceae]|uniref:TPM domain-containing protein n=1 Tax=Enterobacteriaceae TaxID=543 RepID=UPI0004E3151D|nr:TPM domain-containing protein [Yokenella regensburgei]EHN8909273.1 TPM domain-containing protein [Enterobacter hormaechei]KFD22991.1 methanol dehydrogenase beta-propeller domain-containing protein [Yokenella regensburgei ATCC 49455]SQA95756.1 Domain of uncharacterised function (DUF477) [Yokenella regensburgei]SUQ03881.1 Domain of uncharacterised function (DUF477) [Yokenella regensburgei]
MSSVYRYVLILVFTGFISFVQAEQIEVPVMTGHLTDPAELLTPYEHDLLRGIIEGNNKNTGTEVGVLVIPSTGDDTIEQFATKVFDEWRLGDVKRNDGVLLLVAWQDRKVRIEVGYGLEGVITDAIAGRIIKNEIIPQFKQGSLINGIKSGVESINGLINHQASSEFQEPPEVQNGTWWILLLWVFIVIGITKFKKSWLPQLVFYPIPLSFIMMYFCRDFPFVIYLLIPTALTPFIILIPLVFLSLISCITSFIKYKNEELQIPLLKKNKYPIYDPRTRRHSRSRYSHSFPSSCSYSATSSSSSGGSSRGGGGSSGGGGASGSW